MAYRWQMHKAKEEPSFSYCASGYPVITMYGSERLVIENYHKLLCFTQQNITFSTALGKLYIRGTELAICCFSSVEAEVCGHIVSVGFDREEPV